MSSVFCGCYSLKNIPDISKWDVSYVLRMDNMFQGCSSLISLPDISEWKPLFLQNIKGIFYGCSSLISLPDISKWKIFFFLNNISKDDCSLLSFSLFSSSQDISKFDLDNNYSENSNLNQRCKLKESFDRSLFSSNSDDSIKKNISQKEEMNDNSNNNLNRKVFNEINMNYPHFENKDNELENYYENFYK